MSLSECSELDLLDFWSNGRINELGSFLCFLCDVLTSHEFDEIFHLVFLNFLTNIQVVFVVHSLQSGRWYPEIMVLTFIQFIFGDLLMFQ